MRGRGASAALRAGPLGGQRRSSRLLSPADTRPLGAASVWRRVLSCDVATVRRVMASSLTGASAAHWAASTRLGTVAGAVLAMQGRCCCLRLPARGTLRVLWGRGGVHQPTRRPRLLEWKRGLSAACHPKMGWRTDRSLEECNTAHFSGDRYLLYAPLGVQNDLKALEKVMVAWSPGNVLRNRVTFCGISRENLRCVELTEI